MVEYWNSEIVELWNIEIVKYSCVHNKRGGQNKRARVCVGWGVSSDTDKTWWKVNEECSQKVYNCINEDKYKFLQINKGGGGKISKN